jgi:hypothetical protein
VIFRTFPRRSFAALVLGGLTGLGLLVATGGVATAASVSTSMRPTPDPVIADVAPAIGPKAGGASVTITGAHLLGVTSVRFGGTPGKHLDVESDHKLTITTPAHAPGSYRVRLIAPGRSSARSFHSSYRFVTTPTVADVAPPVGLPAGGTSITITGHGFNDATGVRFDGVGGTDFDVLNNSTITVDAPAHLVGTVRVRVIKPGSSSERSDAAQYTYAAVPTVSALSPSAGSTNGLNVTITGTGFDNVSSVYFGSVAVSLYNVISDTQILAVVSGQSAGTVDVTVVTTGGTSATSPASEFTFVTPPSLTSISPSSGPVTGGTSVTITGANLADVTSVDFDTTPASSFTVNDATSITATAPAGSPGVVSITLQTPTASSSPSDASAYTYYVVPAVTLVEPGFGPVAVGTEVGITGTNFSGVTSVSFGSTPADSFTVESDTLIIAVAPAQETPGAVDIAVSNGWATSALVTADQYTFFVPATITGMTPDFGATTGGSEVVISGTGLTNVSTVFFGGVWSPEFVLEGDSQILAIVPAHAAGVVDVTLASRFGSSPPFSFTYADSPSVTSLSRNAGSTDGGDIVTITGTGFTDTSAVSFGGTAADSYTVDSDTQITLVTRSHPNGSVGLTIGSPYGNRNVFPFFTYH